MTNVRAVGAPVDSDCKSYWHMTSLKHSLVYPLQYQQPKSSKLQHQQQQEPGPQGWGVGESSTPAVSSNQLLLTIQRINFYGINAEHLLLIDISHLQGRPRLY